MPDLNTMLVFISASILLGLAPGPDNIFVLSQSISKGSKAGLSITLGLCTGLIIHTLAVALGIAVIFQTSATAFAILKYVGAAYLIYLAYLSFNASKTRLSNDKPATPNYTKLYRRGIIMNISNPKVSIFFLAFLPQFTDAAKGSLTLQLLLLGCLFIICALIVFGAISLLAGKMGPWFEKSHHADKWLNRIAGCLFIGLAVKLALSSNR